MNNENTQTGFDNIARDYDEQLRRSLGAAGAGDIEKFAAYKIEILKKTSVGRDIRRILEFGCGTGRNMAHLQAAFPRCEIAGCDVSKESLAVAAATAPITGGYTHIQTPDELMSAYNIDTMGGDWIVFLSAMCFITFRERSVRHGRTPCLRRSGREGCS